MRIAFLVALGVAIYLTIAMILLASQMSDLEKRVTIFETIRIEVVAPAKDSG